MTFLAGLIVGGALGFYGPKAWQKYRQRKDQKARRIR